MQLLQDELNKLDLTEQVKNNILAKTIITENGCWLLGKTYPRVYFNFRLEFLSRLVLNIQQTDLLALHKTNCNNPSCWNPEHLYAGDARDNTLDSMKIGTFVKHEKLKTHCPYGHEYTPENTKIQKGTNKRKCRECDKNRKRIDGESGWKKMDGNGHYSSKGKS